ncbi:Alanine--tRNA ligase, partial [Coemansia sp. RSA 1937]
MWTAKKVRDTFIEFFQAEGHTFVPSSATVPHDDPTLLALLIRRPILPSLRAHATAKSASELVSGKHNDLDDVGKDVYHHTFFEMMGNCSFGDYFKKEAIEFSWKLLTQVYGLDPERLYVSYFEGNAKDGLPVDNDAKQYWLDLGLPESRVLPFGAKENFWEMGDVGP